MTFVIHREKTMLVQLTRNGCRINGADNVCLFYNL